MVFGRLGRPACVAAAICLLTSSIASGAIVTDPNDPRTWQGASVGTFATLYFGSDNAFVHAVAGADGSQLWRVHLEGVFNAPRAGPLIDGGRLYFQSNDESIYALDRATGQIVWQTPPQVRSRVGLALADDVLYLVGTLPRDTLYAYSLTP